MRIMGHQPNLSAWIGLAIVTSFIVIALFAPWIAPYGESESVSETWASSTWQYWLGTDNIGRDMLSRLIYGARMTIGVALLTTILSFIIGTCAGLLAAIGGPIIDQALSRLVDVMLSIPLLVFALIILSMFGSSIPTLIITIAVLDSTRVFRLARAVAMNIVVLEYVEAAKLRGEGLWWIMRREILPNALPPLIVSATLIIGVAILFEAGLSFLGLSDPNVMSWGLMIGSNRRNILECWWAVSFPGAAIVLTVLSVSLVGDGLNDALNPRLRSR